MFTLVVPLIGCVAATDDPAGAVPADRRGRCCGGSGRVVLAGAAGCLAGSADVAVVCDGLAALVAVPGGGQMSAGSRRHRSRGGIPACGSGRHPRRMRSGRGPAAAPSPGRRRRGWPRRPSPARRGWLAAFPGQVNPVTASCRRGAGGMRCGRSTTARRCCWTLDDFHREAGSGPMATRSRWTGRGAAGVRMPITTRWTRWRRERKGGHPQRGGAAASSRGIPDEMFELLFAALPSHRDLGAGGVLDLDRRGPASCSARCPGGWTPTRVSS